MEPVIRAAGVSRVLEGEVPVSLVLDATLAVAPGEFVAITGPSGSGKSSLLYLLGLLDRPTSGSIMLEGIDTSALDDDALAEARLSHLGFVFQSNFLLPEFTAIENVMLPMQRLGRLPDNEIRERAESLLTSLGLAAQRDKRPNQMSGGQCQRVTVARAPANDPGLILADEPTGNLDTASSATVQSILRDLAHEHNRAVIVITHDRDFAQTADRKIVVVDGRIQSDTEKS